MQKQRNVKKEDIIAAIKECAEKLERTPRIGELMADFSINKYDVNKCFGSYTRALKACGLERTDNARPIKMEALFQDWAGIVRDTGRIPTLNDYSMMSRYSYRPLVVRFGKWVRVAQGMQSFAEKEGLINEWADVLSKVPAYYRRKGLEIAGGGEGTTMGKTAEWITEQTARLTFGHGAQPAGTTLGPLLLPPLMPDRPSYGAPMTACALAHAPTNEMGVVLLFGAMALQLGFVVLKIQQGYPDCEAMRRMEGDRWQKVRIELEFESVNFLRHRHDAKECDLIVCWVHNWREAPMEVVELRRLWHGGAGA